MSFLKKFETLMATIKTKAESLKGRQGLAHCTSLGNLTLWHRLDL